MDLSSLIGWILGFAVIIYGIGINKIGNFWDVSSVLIVVGGTVFSVVASYPFQTLKNVAKHMVFLFQGKKYQPQEAIETLVELAQVARRDGLLSLESRAMELEDPFFRRSVLMVLDAMEEEKVRSFLEDEVAAMEARHEEAAGVYDKASAYAPAFGMIGTLVGLINMLKEMNLDEGASSDLGYNMGVALITTFYGCVLANLVFMPIAKKLRIRNDEEVLYRQIIIEGVIGIQCGDNPKILQEHLASFLEQRQQGRISGEGGSDRSGRQRGRRGRQ